MASIPGPDVPGPDVLEAFGLTGTAVRLAGGEGRSVRIGDAVLKPAEQQYAHWLGETMSHLVADGFRISRPIQTRDGSWHHGGWAASCYEPGAEPDHATAPRWPQIIQAGRAFHRALAGVARPEFLDRRTDWWQTGAQVAWQEKQPDIVPCLRAPYADLAALLRPVAEPAQLIHGDLTGNVLLAEGLPPLVIDFSPYWRPAAFGEAIVVGDALIWHCADTGLVRAACAETGAGFVQHVLRAVIYRLVTTSERIRSQNAESTASTAQEVRRYERATKLVCDMARTLPAQIG